MRESKERAYPGDTLSRSTARSRKKRTFSKNPHFDFEPQNHINYFYNLLNCVNVPNMPKTRRGGGVYKHVTTK